MGHKVNPKIIRLGITRDWDSKWYASKKTYTKLLHQDLEIEKLIYKQMKEEGVAQVEIMRTQGKVIINIHTSKPGVVIGRGGETIEKLKDTLSKKFKETFAINIKEIKKPMLDARIVGDNLAVQVEKRVSYRRASKMAIEKTMEAGAIGVKIYLGGRLNGVEISRGEFFSKGKIPLQTFRANIDYASVTAYTTYGKIGIKVWIYKGDVFKKDMEAKLLEQIEEIKQS
ncbi:30S ribosomal protein S3 [Candidatus Peregrinibacteria bacterium RIFCSPLOWO2_01_FULL_39_12]|nr:MAG: 30S ribosomal protein S3 [Candidatus Peregrinibacteria bacterium RIFCSPLOWO2_01_FULL_39_12]OGJ43402.1 MAG: 30S ribosomal protein S3 [Candidatus Peregrinibacteria bacterium RIFCSPLOWO2_02_FULL_39_10]